jgi:ArsR family transcriptional regulator
MAAGKTARTTKRRENAAPEQVDLMFRAFCDRTRLRILSLLQDGEFCVGDIVAILGVPQPRVSRHLGHLRKAGLVVARKSGLWIHYSLAPATSTFHRKLLDCAVSCFQEVPQIRADVAKAARLRKSGGCCPRS